MYKKNDVRLTNDFFTGEFDLYEGVEILKANKIIDIKSSYDWTTFPSICDKLEPKYDYQIHTLHGFNRRKQRSYSPCFRKQHT